MVVELEPYEFNQGARAALDRYTASVARGDKQGHGCEEDWQITLTRDIIGALGELAFAKGCNRFWSGSVGTYKAGDVGEIQVRTCTKPGHCLIVREDDADDDRFVLVRMEEGTRRPRFHLVGWVYGREAKQPQYRRAPVGRPPAYFVPDSALRSLKTAK